MSRPGVDDTTSTPQAAARSTRGCGVGQRAAAGQQVGQQPGLERAALAGTARHPGQPGAGRRRRGRRPRSARRATDASRSPTRITPPASRATSASDAERGDARQARRPGGGPAACRPAWSGRASVCDATAYTRVPCSCDSLAQPEEHDRRLVLGLEADQRRPRRRARGRRTSRPAGSRRGRRGTTASSSECGAGAEVDVVGAEDGAGELAVGVGVLAGQPAPGEHADRRLRAAFRPRAATANASGQDAGAARRTPRRAPSGG